MRSLLTLHRATVGYTGLAQKLLDVYGSPEQTLREFDYRLTSVPNAVGKVLLEKDLSREIDADLQWLEGHSRHLVWLGSENYPPRLKELSDPPLVLFLWGDPNLLASEQISIVGSRRPTNEGISIAIQLAGELAKVGFTITSGLALGIDAAAHRGVLDVSGTTIAVQGCGTDSIYPRHHERLALQILERGCLVTEYPTGFRPHARYFPQRNRIVTGLSRGTLVVEAAAKSGSLISARLAMEQGREVFVVPGSIRSAQNEGCHQLIRQGATLVTGLLDIVDEFHDFEVRRQERRDLSPTESVVLEALKSGPCHADKLHEETEIPIAELVSVLIGLEVKGEIESGVDGYTSRRDS